MSVEARVGKGPEDAEPGDPCGMLDDFGGEAGQATICPGTLQCYVDVLGKPSDCACHINPPCGACLDAPLVCNTCCETVP